MPRGHAKNEAEKSMKCRLSALGNTNTRGKTWKQVNKPVNNNGWFKQGIVNYPSKKTQDWLGSNNPNWLADRSMLVKNEKKHLDSKYKIWMLGVKNRDNWKCKIINSACQGRLEAHHILNWKQYPELRYDINNGITLCQAHHPRGRENESKLSPYFKQLVADKQ